MIHQPSAGPVGHLGIVLNAGSRDETEMEHGIAHFIEHCIFKGTKTRRAYHVLSRMEDVGGELNAYTTKEETALYATFLTDDYPRAAELLSDILFNSVFPEKELEREKEVIAEEINSYKDSPSELIFDDFDELVFDGHPIARNILGTFESVRSFNREDIFRFISRNYHTDQLVISSVGQIDFKRLVHLCGRYFGNVPENVRNQVRQRFTNYSPGQKSIQKETFQTHCILGNIAYDSLHPSRIVMILLNNLLGGQGMNSRLNLSLRERKGMAYNIESSYNAFSDTGLFNVYFGTENENFEKALQVVYQEFRLLREKKLGSLQMSRAQKQLIGQLAIAGENHEDLMLSLGKTYLFYNQVDPFREVFRKIEAITPEQILEVANEILNPDQMSMLVYR
ncbi:MAG TPA: pitrilysin family protein [Prolixibacteraceae bacterium]|nr:pitrilysin family protein [Prolixibacteraceae bacterium]